MSRHNFPPLQTCPWWLAGSTAWGGHMQTIWTALFAKAFDVTPTYRRERWATPDGDFIDVDWLVSTNPTLYTVEKQPLMVLLHGLEGSSQSQYAQTLAYWCKAQGWAFAVPHFRSCSGDINNAPRLYHMGDYVEADWILQRMAEKHVGPVVAVGASLGGNVLLRWAVESGGEALKKVSAIATICAPLDLVTNANQMDKGLCKWIYTEMFLRTMRPKAEQKFAQYPQLFDIEAVRRSKTFAEFDALITAPLHGFKGAHDYWTRSSITNIMLERIRIPSLVLNARNDPFIPAKTLPPSSDNACLTFLQPQQGGHMGFTGGCFPGNTFSFAHTIGTYLKNTL